MPVQWEKLAGKPVSIFTYSGRVLANTVMEAIQQNIQFASESGQKMYTIVDIRQIDPLHFPDLLRIVGQVSRSVIKDGEDPAAMTILVGSGQTAKLYQDMLKAQGAPPMPLVETVDEALGIVNVKMGEANGKTPE
jgi:hypothetical protein